MTIHREGYTIIGITIALLAILNGICYLIAGDTLWLLWLVGVFSVVFFLLILQFFRYPKRSLTRNERYVVCPADGKVVVIEKTFEAEYFKDERIQVSVFMSPLNVHANWYPVSGRVKVMRHHPGKKLVAWHPKASTENERTTLVIERDNQSEILVRQIAGALANRIVFYPMEGDVIRQCAEWGFIKFGSRVDIFLPFDADIAVELGQKVTGGIDVIAKLKS
jgi:phosphatidylserine decarboxylase